MPAAPSSAIIDPNQETLHTTPRILGILPNFTAVDSNSYLPRLFTGEKFNIAAHDNVDYSSFLLVAVLAGKGLYSNTIPGFGTGAAGFRRYYWREFTDQVSGTFFTEAILPTLTPRTPATTPSARTASSSAPATPSAAALSPATTGAQTNSTSPRLAAMPRKPLCRTSTTPSPNAASANPPKTSPPR